MCKGKFFILSLLLLFSFTTLYAQNNLLTQPELHPKREFRGVWIATVVNIDWPSAVGMPVQKQKDQLVKILDFHQQSNMNAIMFQVRPAADAFYAKGREPWSRWLTGRQGKDPGYDPLDFAITESHKRGMELHAWVNPYRATFDNNYVNIAPNHITKTHPEWFFIYGGQKLFNPGLPEVREYIVQVVLDIVKNYDVDGIHMDDYFYPYLIAGQKLQDAEAFAQYGGDFSDIRDWRRNSVDLLIKMVGDSIHKYKPNIKWGVSPRGIWRNKNEDPEGSDTHGGAAYSENYADTRKWMKEGWVDYMNPQIYWQIGNRSAAFDVLTEWWSNNTFGRHLYIGQAPYRIAEGRSYAFHNPNELPNQVKITRLNPRVQGSVYFSSNSLTSNLGGFADSLRQNYYRYPALPPAMMWRDSIAPNAPLGLVGVNSPKGVVLTWQEPAEAKDKEPTFGYVIYRFDAAEKITTGNAANILYIKYNTERVLLDNTAQRGKKYIYIVTALDKMKNESEHSEPYTVIVPAL
ncbi:glycoside hydrolase family 10 protein [Mucilaginibacter ginkgonis]|uniref:Family 10 glycosylhydrolase n=1 Tax=Mucilaginibacter ginkgonis TaxID=2682091 RepID=A0A6I4HZ88_9SPHI|nr:family 10 glycosylhydrolase [Mucilaginibacter ginkgonis]QQL49782.1 family 10 glycosylhydrolase [Mucilaginibacter ginkgonis]